MTRFVIQRFHNFQDLCQRHCHVHREGNGFPWTDSNRQCEHDLETGMNPTMKKMTVPELVDRYLSTKTGMKPNTVANYKFVRNLLLKEEFSGRKIGDVKTSDAKMFLIKLQNDGRRHSSIKTVRGVLRPAFQMAVDDDCLIKNPFAFSLAGVVINDSVTREAITNLQMKKFLRFVHDDVVYCKYYETVWIHRRLRLT